jgi:hypothetical protein
MSYLTAKGWLTVPEREFLKNAAGRVPINGVVLNIGVEFGASIHCVRAGNKSCNLVAVDLIGARKFQGQIEGDSVGFYEMDSGELAKQWVGEIDFAFIDGDHTYEGVLSDCEFLHSVKVDGIAAFHDCYSWESPPKTVHKVCPDVNRAVEDWKADNPNWQELEHVDSIRVFRRLS